MIVCKKTFNEKDMSEEDYIFVISNIILSQTDKFKYEDIINKLKTMFKNITTKIENIVKNCLVRLREDGFLIVLGSNYSVIKINI